MLSYLHKPQTSRDAPYLSLLQEMPSSLIFIMGCHRSGTSLLHHLLAYTEQFNYISVYDIIHYDELLYNRIHGREAQSREALLHALAAIKDRSFDRLPVGADYPEEYRFLLSELKIPLSLRAKKRIEFFAPHLTPKTLDRFLEICRKKQFLVCHKTSEDTPLLLKNPNDFYCHFMNIHAMLPEIRFIFVHRHPLYMLNSHLHSFCSLVQTMSVYWSMLEPGYRRLFGRFPLKRVIALRAMRTVWYARLVVSQYIRSFLYYLDQIPHLLPKQYISLRYEDLCRDPEGCVSRVGQWLQMDITPSIPENFIAPRKLPLLDSAAQTYKKQLEDLKPYLDHLNYPAFL